jgi:hypothetical protein
VHVPDSVSQRVRALKERSSHNGGADDWGTSNT